MKVLVLGHKGMLGHMVCKFFMRQGLDVVTTDLRWESTAFRDFVKAFNGDYIINCIGAIHQKRNDFDVNWELPIFLDWYTKVRIIHPGTDCEQDEDKYGLSKRIARNFIVNDAKNTKSLKCSIIGPELNSKVSLMEWFLSNPDGTDVFGFSEFYWNGNTTLTWAKQAYMMMQDWGIYPKETILGSSSVSKKEILEALNKVFDRKINIIDKPEPKVDKRQYATIITKHISKQLEELRDFYYV